MEPVSFGLALAGLPGIFTACLDCYKRIQNCVDFEDDFDIALCKLQAAEVRLSRWGDLSGIGTSEPKLDQHGYRPEDIILAYHWLREIKKAFDCAIKTSEKCKTTADREGLQWPVTEVQSLMSNSTRPLHYRVRRFVYQQIKPRKRERAAWALYRKEPFESLVDNISSLTCNLVELFPLFNEAQTRANKAQATLYSTIATECETSNTEYDTSPASHDAYWERSGAVFAACDTKSTECVSSTASCNASVAAKDMTTSECDTSSIYYDASTPGSDIDTISFDANSMEFETSTPESEISTMAFNSSARECNTSIGECDVSTVQSDARSTRSDTSAGTCDTGTPECDPGIEERDVDSGECDSGIGGSDTSREGSDTDSTTSNASTFAASYNGREAYDDTMIPANWGGYQGREKFYSQICVKDYSMGHFGDNIYDGKSYNNSVYSDINVRGYALVHFGDNLY